MNKPESITDQPLHKPYIEIDPLEAKIRLDEGEGVLIDVRSESERSKEGIVPNSQNIDYGADDFEKKLEKLDKNKCYIVHCHGGGRSSQTVALMRELGFVDVHNLKGGISRWKSQGLSVE